MLTLTEAKKRLNARQISSIALVKDSLKTIQAENDKGSVAFTIINEHSAIQAAEAADLLRASGYDRPLLGIPISIKDSMDVQGEVTSAGSCIFNSRPKAEKDSDAVAAIKRAGAIIMGKTNMSEFAFSGLGINPHYGTPTHPVRTEFVAGGSTSGGAVSVASGAVFAALGSDTGGSLRIPAAFCDVVGFKPTASRVSTKGVVPLSYTYDSVGAITRSVDDCIVMDQVLSGEEYTVDDISLKNLRFFVTHDYVMDDLDVEVSDQFQSVIAMLKAQGAIIVEGDFKELANIPSINSKGGLTAAEIWCEHEEFFDELKAQYDPLVAQRIERGQHISAADYLKVIQQRKELIAIAEDKLAYIDAWLMPTVSVKPPKLEALQDDTAFFKFNGAVLRNTTVTNFLDGCAISLPLGDGMGLSISGLNNSDYKILAIAKSIETLLKQQ